MSLTPEKHQSIESLARALRNLDSYDDWTYGTEVIPNDRTWCQIKHEMNSEQQVSQTVIE
jgi:hypothetical protein